MPSRRMIEKKNAEEKLTKQEFLDINENPDAHPLLKLEITKKAVNTPHTSIDRLLLHTTVEIELRLRHALIPGLNLGQWPLASCDELRIYPKCKLSVPRPVFITPKHCARVDPCHKRTQAVSMYRKRLSMGGTRYETALKTNRELRAKEKEGVYHMALFEFAERMERHPDPYFHGSYDYYYTGGNLCVLPEKGQVVHVDGDDLRNLNVSQFPTHKDYTVKPLRFICAQLQEEPSEIFEVRPLQPLRADRPNCFAIRQRNSITLQTMLPQKSRLKPITSFRSKYTPFISFAQSSHDAHAFVASTMKQQVRWYDLNSATPTLRSLYDLNRNGAAISWNTVKSWREHVFLYANEQKLCLMDKRTTPAEWLRHSVPGSAPLSCDFLSSLAVSEFSNLIYVGTNHKLHCLDVRYMGDAAAAAQRAYICSWTHQLEYAPTFVETFRNASSEFIALSSPVAGDLRICELTRTRNLVEHALTPADATQSSKPSRYTYKSPTLPYQPPTLQEAYEAARNSRYRLNPNADLKNRVRCCTTGITFYAGAADTYAEAADALLLVATSNGDVFAHTIGERQTQEHEPRTNSASDAMMAKMAKQICEMTQPPLNYTDIVQMRAMSKVFRCEALDVVREQDDVDEKDAQLEEFLPEAAPEVTPKTPKRKRHMGRWQKSMHELHQYKDALVPDLLACWDIPYEDEKCFPLKELDKERSVKPDPDSKVRSWLNESREERPMISIPIVNIRDSIKMDISSQDIVVDDMGELNESAALIDNSMTLGALPQSTQLTDDIVAQMDSSALEMQQNISALGLSMSKSKAKKRKTKYVKGF